MSSLILPTQKRFIRPDDKPPFGFKLNKKHKLAQGLVGAWVMNEYGGNTAYDLSGNGNNGTIVGADWVPDGIESNANYEHIEIPISYSGGTIVFGFESTGVTPTFRYVIMGATTTELYLLQFPTTNEWRLNLQDGYVDSSGYALNIGEHYQFAVQWPDRKVYINNDLIIDSTSKSSTITELNVGANPDSSGRYSNGIFKYVYIYNRTLFPSDIAQLHRTPYAMFQPTISPAGILYYEPPAGGNWFLLPAQNKLQGMRGLCG